MLTNEEWYMETPFGKIAMISWGKRHLPPVLLVHGFVDTAATFIPLVQHLPDTHYYVSFDFPGHGKSDLVSSGPPISQTFMLEIIRLIVDHMQWDTFVFVAHSMGIPIGLFYHHVFPGKMKKMINLDPYYSLLRYTYFARVDSLWYKIFYESYYDRYERSNEQPALMTYDQAVRTVMEERNLSYHHAELMLSRNLVQVEPGLYRRNIQPTILKLIHFPAFEDTLEYIITSNTLPKLNIHASETKERYQTATFSSKIMCFFDDPTSKHNLSVHVSGCHDVHVTNPEKLVPYIKFFLEEENNEAIASKL